MRESRALGRSWAVGGGCASKDHLWSSVPTAVTIKPSSLGHLFLFFWEAADLTLVDYFFDLTFQDGSAAAGGHRASTFPKFSNTSFQ